MSQIPGLPYAVSLGLHLETTLSSPSGLLCALPSSPFVGPPAQSDLPLNKPMNPKISLIDDTYFIVFRHFVFFQRISQICG